jgi:hypothetical protein
MGQETILSGLRQKYWIVNARSAVKYAKRNCQKCSNATAKIVVPLMGQLPAARLTPYEKPFTYASVDLFGPLQITVGRHREKRYSVIFVCMVTRAIHIEIANNLSSDAFIVCLRNFFFRRGPCAHMWSDNGTNMVGALKEMKDSISEMQNQVAEKASELEIQWHFNPPAASHFGGAWERLIQIVKRCLEAILHSTFPHEDTLRSALVEAEYVVNSRPLTHVPVESNEEEPLTPNHFLIGCSGNIPLIGNYHKADMNARRQWKIATNLTNMFWRRWLGEYLPELTRRSKWHKYVKPVEVGDVVVVFDENHPRKYWKIAIVTEVYPGKDDVVRTVKLKTENGSLKRPVAKVAVLDIGRSFQTN